MDDITIYNVKGKWELLPDSVVMLSPTGLCSIFKLTILILWPKIVLIWLSLSVLISIISSSLKHYGTNMLFSLGVGDTSGKPEDNWHDSAIAFTAGLFT